MPAPISVTHFSDPGCPWAYSAWPALSTLAWRYGDQLDWTLVTIGLREDPHPTYTPEAQAHGYVRFRDDYGMPFATGVRERGAGTGRACRAIVATRLHAPEHEVRVFRALQRLHFTTGGLFDTDEGIRTALAWVPGVDADAIVAAIDTDAVEDAYQADRARTRSAAGTPTEFQGRSANSDGAVRYTAPSVIFTHADGRSFEVGGFQPVEAYDVAIANLDTSLTRRPAGDDVVEILAAFDHPLTTAEVVAIRSGYLAHPDVRGTEQALVSAVAAGTVQREGVGSDAWWTAT